MGFLTFIFFGIVFFALWRRLWSHPIQLPLPPGPRGSLLYGVKKLLQATEPWKTYAAWSKDFASSVISFRVYNHRIVVLNDASSIRDLLEKRAAIYSDRPKSWMYHEICDRKKAVFNISSQDPRHKQYRRLLQSGLSARATQEYWPLLQSEIGKLLDGLKASPMNYEQHIRRNSAAVIMKLAYGYSVQENDLFINVAEEANKISGLALAPGRWLVDYLPVVRFIPSFLPGAGWKRQGETWRERLDYLSGVPHEWVKQQMKSGNYEESFTSRHLLDNGGRFVNSELEDIIKWCAGGLHAGASDTTVSAILSFVHLMALHPETQFRIREEIDAVVGRGSFPKPSDVPRLSFLEAVYKETLRFAPIANLALPHKVIEDDEYEGLRIPKGSTIVANVWAVMHDPIVYPNPFTFSPDRFTSSNDVSKQIQADPRIFAFGFGRRRCPGVTFAETAMLLTMANIISRFEIALPRGSITPKLEFTSGITSHVKLFNITITPRETR